MFSSERTGPKREMDLMLSLRACLLAGLSGALAVPAAAQTPTPAANAASDEDIIVTARRQDERLVEVPAAITVLTGEVLERTGADRTQDFVQLTPGVTMVTGTAEAGDTQINIRGINGARDAESSVALVVDGILKTNTAQLNQPQGTLRQVEILKGPQGAIYGRNAAAGAIVISTLKPGDSLEGAIKASYASFDTAEVTAHIAGPITENIGFVLSGYYRSTDGFYKNDFLDASVVDDQEVWTLDGRILAELGDATSLDLKARYSQLRGASIAFNAAFHLPNFAAVNPDFYEDVNKHPFNFYSNIRPENEQDSFDVSAKLDHDFGAVRLTAWALYSDVDQNLTADGTSADFARYISNIGTPDSTAANDACFASTAALTGYPVNSPGFIGAIPVPFIFAPANGSTFGPYSPSTCDGTQYQVRNQTDYSTEIRLASSGDGPLNWLVGFYYLHIDREVGVSLGADLGEGVTKQLYNPPGTSNPTSQLFWDNFTTNVYAVFGALDWKPSDRLAVNFALRYDVENREVDNQVPFVNDPITGGPLNPGQAFGPIESQSESWKQPQPKLSVRYGLTDDINVYVNWGIGFKSGGFNNSGSAAIVQQNFVDFIGSEVAIEDQFDKEVSSAFEVGFKGSLLDKRVTFELAGYYTKVKDMQFFEFFVGSFGLLRVVSNIDKVDIWGGELNLNGRITDNWSVFTSVNVQGSEIKENASRPITVGNKSPYTADYTINVGTQFDMPLNDTIDLIFRTDYRLVGPTWFHTVQDDGLPTLFSGLLPISPLGLPAVVGNGRYDVARRDSYGIWNLRAGASTDRFSITVFVDNILNTKYLNEVIPAVEFGGSFISPGGRRLIGVEAGFKF